MAAILHRAGRNDECVRHVQRASDELFAAATGNVLGRYVAKDIWEDEQEDECALGGDSGVRRLLGTLPETGFQQAGYAGHSVVRAKLVAGICDACGVANSRAKFEARVQSARRITGRNPNGTISCGTAWTCPRQKQRRDNS